MNDSASKVGNKLRILTLVYWVIGLTPLAVAAVCYILVATGNVIVTESVENIYLVYLAFFIAIGAIPLGSLLFKNLTSKVSESTNPFATYQTANIIRAAIMEAPGLLAAVAILLTGKLELLAVPVAMLIFFYLNKPTAERFEALTRK